MATRAPDEHVPRGTCVVIAAGLAFVATLLEVTSFIASESGATAMAFTAMAVALAARLVAGVLAYLSAIR